RADRDRRPRQRGQEGQAPDGPGHPRPAGDRVASARPNERLVEADRSGADGPASRAGRRPVEVLVILDGASEPVGDGDGPTSLERAVTPALDALAAEGTLSRVRTVAPWLEPGSESAIPALLGWIPPAAVDRGIVEAAARGIDVPDGTHA